MSCRARSEELGSIDVLLIPVGGYYTIDAAQAKRITDAVKPRIIVPMHYRHGAQGLQQVCGVDRFLELFRSADIRMLSRHSALRSPTRNPACMFFHGRSFFTAKRRKQNNMKIGAANAAPILIYFYMYTLTHRLRRSSTAHARRDRRHRSPSSSCSASRSRHHVALAEVILLEYLAVEKRLLGKRARMAILHALFLVLLIGVI